MASPDEIASRFKERFTAANVTVQESPKGYRVVIAEPGHRTIDADLAPAMVDTGIHLLWIWRKARG